MASLQKSRDSTGYYITEGYHGRESRFVPRCNMGEMAEVLEKATSENPESSYVGDIKVEPTSPQANDVYLRQNGHQSILTRVEAQSLVGQIDKEAGRVGREGRDAFKR